MNTPPSADRKWNERCNEAAGASRDLTERRRAEAALEETQRLLASVTENLSEAIYRSDPDHRLTFVNRAYLMMFGFESLAELQAIPRVQLYADPQARTRLLDLLARAERFRDQEVEYVRRDGRHLWGLASGQLIRDPATGKPAYYVGAITDITARKQAEDKIRRLNATLERRIAKRTAELSTSEARFRTLVEHAPEAIVVFDGGTGRFESCNKNAARLYGLEAEQVVGLHPADVSPEVQPDGRRSREAAREVMQRALAGEAPVFEWTHRHLSGRLIPCEVRLVRLPGDRPNRIRASITDNTQRHRREQVQRATYEISEAVHTAGDLDSLYARIHAIVGGLMPAQNFYIAVFDPATDLIRFAYYVDELSSRPEPRRPDTGLTGYVLRTGKPLLVDGAMNRRKKRVGDAVTFEGFEGIVYLESGAPAAIWLGVPLSSAGRPFGVMAVQDYRDADAYGEEEKQILTFVAAQTALAIERKKAEEALRQRHREVTTLLESLPGYAFFKDAKGRYLMANQNFCHALGVTRESIVGQTDRNLFAPELAEKYRVDDARLLASGEPLLVGEEQMVESGRALFVQTTKVPVKNERGEPVGLIGLGFDITERKRAEAELLKALEREKELGQLKSNFVSLVSHEFRTPLGIIMSSSEILEDYLEQLDPEERRQHLQSIQKNTRRMADLMEEVLLLAQFDAGRMEFKPAPIDLRAFCQRVTGEVESATHRRCRIDLKVGPLTVPAHADERLLQHIFTNLLHNAVKYSEPDSPVEFTVDQDGREAVCVIRDRGIGIPEPDREWLFHAFHRGQNVGQRPGTGLGLVVVQRCIERHGGSIRAESQIGQGTTMTARLPVFPDGRP